LWAAVGAKGFGVATVPHRGQGYDKMQKLFLGSDEDTKSEWQEN
jgi:hypothetical protein